MRFTYNSRFRRCFRRLPRSFACFVDEGEPSSPDVTALSFLLDRNPRDSLDNFNGNSARFKLGPGRTNVDEVGGTSAEGVDNSENAIDARFFCNGVSDTDTEVLLALGAYLLVLILVFGVESLYAAGGGVVGASAEYLVESSI